MSGSQVKECLHYKNCCIGLKDKGKAPTILTRHILRVHRIPQEDPIYGMFFGAGAIYQGAQVGWRTKHSVGRLRRSWGHVDYGSFFPFFTLEPKQPESNQSTSNYSLDDQPPREDTFLTILVTTLERLFLGLRPYWGTEQNPLHYTAVRKDPRHLRPYTSIAYCLVSLIRHGTPEHGYFSQNIEKLELHMQDGFTVDGEGYLPDLQKGPVQITDGGTASFIQFS